MYLQLAESLESRSLINEDGTLSGGFFSKIASAVKDVSKKVVQTVKKIGLAVPRNSYLGLVALNVHGFASSLEKTIAADEKKVRSKWESLGGDFGKLRGAVNQGKKKKHLFDGDSMVVLSEESESSVRVQTLSNPGFAAAIASAAPIIAAIAPLLKAFVKDPEAIKQIDAAVETAKALNPSQTVDPTDPSHATKFDTEKGKEGFLSSIPAPVLYIGGAVLIGGTLYAIFRKK